MNEVIRITSDQFDGVVAKSSLVIIDFTANWCPPCRVMDPVFKQTAAKYGSRAQFLKVNSDENPELIARFSIQSLPTFLFLREGQVVDRLVGSRPGGEFESEIQEFLTAVPETSLG
jgi:thioredoxin